jgi:hypothetical protein
MEAFTEWLSGTSVSLYIQTAGWVIPTMQIIHIFAIATVLGASVILQLRVLGLAGFSSSTSDTVKAFVPWIWSALPVLAVTGSILIIGEPDRALGSGLEVFVTKMVALTVASALTLALQIRTRRGASGDSPIESPLMRATAIATLLCWVVVATAGRWIAYW